jgi:hypothetical protein
MDLLIRQQFGSPRWKVPTHRRADWPRWKEYSLSRPLHIAAAANQLNRKLFDKTDLQGSVMVDEGRLEILVHGNWPGSRPGNFAGFSVSWRELPIAA